MLHCPRNTMRIVLYSVIILASGFTSAEAADPTGDWRVADGVANIRVAQCNGSMWGVVVWEQTPGGRDTNNPDVSKKSRPIIGMPILIDMKKKVGVDQWEGQVYNAKDGQFYSSTITPTSADQLEIKGCVLGFLCGGETWTRVAPPIPSSPANSMANSMTKGAPKSATPPKSAAPPRNVATTGTSGAGPKTTASVGPAGKKTAAAPAADPVGDICLLPDIAGFSH